MKFLDPVAELPPPPVANPCPPERVQRRLTYLEAKRHAPKWLPVECADYRDALYLAIGARKHSKFRFEAEQRGRICYLRFVGRLGLEPIFETSAEAAARRTHERISA